MTQSNNTVGRSNAYPWAVDVGLLLIRVIVGVVFAFHGSQKLFGWFGGPGLEDFAGFLGGTMHLPLPMVNAVLAGSAEFFGGLALIIGLFVRVAAVPMTVTMIVAVLGVHRNAFSGQGGMEYPLTLGVILIALIFMGGGRWSIVNAFRPRRPAGAPGAVATS